MDYLRIADLLHADTMNFLLEANGLHHLQKAEAAGPILMRHDPPDWIVIVPQPAIDGYVAVPMLRRLRQQDGGHWRHFPMAVPDTAPLHEYEMAGAPLAVQPLAELPTWSCCAAFAALPELPEQLRNLVGCLEVCSYFPALASLRATATRLREYVSSGWHRSSELQLELLVAEQHIAGASCWKGFCSPRNQVSQVPASKSLLGHVVAIYQAIWDEEIQIGSARISEAFLESAGHHFDLEGSSFVLVSGETGGSLTQASNWARKERVKLLPRALGKAADHGI